jgi:cysteine synthase B
MKQVSKNIFEAIGNTPLVQLRNIDGLNPRVRIYGKLEGCNPGGSVKDRAAYYMIERAEESGELTREKIIVEPTSGNTGIALAMIGSAKGYRVKLFMPECVSTERQICLQAFGAEVILTPADEATDGAIIRARQFCEQEPDKYFMPNQFDNPNNLIAHYATTGPEIYEQTGGELDVYVAGLGTSGTLIGAGRYLKEKNKNIRVVAVEPVEGHSIQGLKNMNESINPGIYDPGAFDEKIMVNDEEAFDITRKLATREGIFVGMSSGAAVYGAIQIAKLMDKGTIVVILPDRGDRYLSTTLFRSICAKCPP